jgi:hypothetical protein
MNAAKKPYRGTLGHGTAGCGALLLVLVNLGSIASAPTPESTLSLEEALSKASVDGKYRMLLAQIKVEKDRDIHKEFCDFGFHDRKEYEGHKELPEGFWVYVAPYWYIWRDHSSIKREKRPWGPEQATGEPDTPNAGDQGTAWASQTEDGQQEWLLLEYDHPLVPVGVVVHETYNPGALYKVTAFRLDGSEVEIWKGKDPTAPGADKGISDIPVKIDFKTARIKIYLDSIGIAGWNEIDAVGIRDKEKKTHWALRAEASSTYATPYPPVDKTFLIQEDRIRRLQDEIKQLKKANEELKEELKKKNRQ